MKKKYSLSFMDIYYLSFLLLVVLLILDLWVFTDIIQVICICLTVVVFIAGAVFNGLARARLRKYLIKKSELIALLSERDES